MVVSNFSLHMEPVLEVRILFKNFFGSVSERLMEAVLKTVERELRRFKSCRLRQFIFFFYAPVA